MIMQIFTVYDAAIQAFVPPFFVRSKGEAVRSFTDACNDEKSNFARHPLDYTLMHVGEYDDNGAVFTTHAPVRVIGATECRVDEPFKEENRVKEAGNGIRRLPM